MKTWTFFGWTINYSDEEVEIITSPGQEVVGRIPMPILQRFMKEIMLENTPSEKNQYDDTFYCEEIIRELITRYPVMTVTLENELAFFKNQPNSHANKRETNYTKNAPSAILISEAFLWCDSRMGHSFWDEWWNQLRQDEKI